MSEDASNAGTVALDWKEVYLNTAKELLEERWKKVTVDKLPEPTSLRLG